MGETMDCCMKRQSVKLGILMMAGLLLLALVLGALRPPQTREAQALWGGDGAAKQNRERMTPPRTKLGGRVVHGPTG
jgi:hypothetical protein